MAKVTDEWYRSLEGKQFNDYKLDKFIGNGKIGYVYKASNLTIPGLNKAIKVIKGHPKDGWETELKKVALLNNVPNVVQFDHLETTPISHMGITEPIVYTIWSYIDNAQNLKDYLNDKTFVPASFVISVVETILKVLHACQKIDQVKRHGDLHSGNILIQEPDERILNESLEYTERVWVSDFGYGVTGKRTKKPKDDYDGLIKIINDLLQHVNWTKSTESERELINKLKDIGNKLLGENQHSEKHTPLSILNIIKEIKNNPRSYYKADIVDTVITSDSESSIKVGTYQVAEMLGDKWSLWQKLFVPKIPSRSKILEPDIPTVVTGPRGCGKTMIFRRFSEKLMLECGPLDKERQDFIGFFANGNDFADAFSNFPEEPNDEQTAALICYASLTILTDVLAVQTIRIDKKKDEHSDIFISFIKELLLGENRLVLLEGENPLLRLRYELENIKWEFPHKKYKPFFPGYKKMSRINWLPHFISELRRILDWITDKTVILFIDDYTLPRVSESMQKILNRMFLRRSSQFVSKIATEAATTFIAEDSSGKQLQDGDDFALIDMAEESLFMQKEEKEEFLLDVFARRLCLDNRIPNSSKNLKELLGKLDISITEHARRLRGEIIDTIELENSSSSRRGSTKPKVLYYGYDVFCRLWSGDTRTMVQLVQDLVDETYLTNEKGNNKSILSVSAEIQDRVFRNRGGQWLISQSRNQPTSQSEVTRTINNIRQKNPQFTFCGDSYGTHLKAIVEAFVKQASFLLFSKPYIEKFKDSVRTVPRMAFRLEIIDEFRITGLAAELYKDLIRYGLFMRDARGKSRRGAMVPRLFLRRFLLPYCTLALSQKDCVTLTSNEFEQLLLYPDKFDKIKPQKESGILDPTQINLFSDMEESENNLYNDLDFEDLK